MSKQVAVAVIHGMGSQGVSFAEPMITEINQWITKSRKNPDEIAWQPIYWADVLETRQLKYLRDANRNNDLDYVKLRTFVVTAFGDAVAYQRVPTENNTGGKTTYERIHERIERAINDLLQIGLGGQSKPLIVMGHSLGGHIMSNYIWDMQKGHAGTGLSAFERMRSLAGMVTFGCNIPLFTFAFTRITPIKFPAPQLHPDLKRKAKWLNYYDPDDILGYPLKPISPSYRQVVTRDVPINVGGWLSSWNPASHSQYWTDNDFTKPVAKFIASFL